jgi:hypothetical protein
VKKQNATTNNGCKTYYYGKRIGMLMWRHAWHGKYDAMQPIQIKRKQNSNTHTYGSSCFTTRQFKCWLAWKDKVWVSYTKLNEAGKNIISISHILHMLLIRCNAKYHVTLWCEMQTRAWMSYSDSTHFSDKFSYKILFISNYHLKVINFASLTYLQEFFRKQRNKWIFSHRREPSPSGWLWVQEEVDWNNR